MVSETMPAKEAKNHVGCSGNHLGCPKGADIGLQYGLSGNSVPDMETFRLELQRETTMTATHGSSWGNPTEPQAVRFTISATTYLYEFVSLKFWFRAFYIS